MDSDKDTDKEKNVSCFALDGVVAEMVIEVEDNQKPGFEESSFSPSKNSNNSSEENADCVKNVEDKVISLEEVPCEKDPENEIPKTSPQLSETLHPLETVSSETAEPSTTDSTETSQPSAPDSAETNQPSASDSAESTQPSASDSAESTQPSACDSSEPKLNNKQVNEEKLVNEEKKVHNVKKIIKRRHIVSSNHFHNETSGIARYPGRKRQANKRYISDEMVTSTANKSESSLSKETHKGEKRRKLNAKDERNEKIDSQRKSSVSSKDYDSNSDKEEHIKTRNELAGKIKSEYPEVPEEKMDDEPKHKTLRKLPFRKNKDAPEVPDLEPKVILWNGVGEGVGAKLGDLPEVRNRIQGAKSVRALYRVLFYQWPTNGQDLIGQILEFNGFPFDRTSYEFTKRQSLMKIMLDVTIANVCDILGVKKGSNKSTMINNILNFLLRPYGKIDPALDPSLQPVVLLERIVLDDKFFQNPSESLKPKRLPGRPKGKNQAAKKEIPPAAPLRTTRNTRREGSETSLDKKTSLKENLKASNTKPSSPREKDSSDAKRRKASATEPAKVIKDDKPKVEGKSSEEATKSTNENDSASSKKTAVKMTKKIRKKKKLKPGNKMKLVSKKPAESASENRDFEMEVDNNIEEMEEPSSTVPKEDKLAKESKEDQSVVKPINDVSPDSSETESAEETRLITASASTSKSSPKSPQMRRGKPLKMFPQISDSIKNANFAALQRLHILLFGAADKAENLKGNILAFGGFPFLEGSDEWKQKHFLLSLLAQSNLREYLKLLCIEFSDDDQPTMINKLMRFLACPTEAALGKKSPEKQTEVSTTEIVAIEVRRKETESQPKKDKLETKKKNVKKKDEKKPPRNRKILMSEEEARRLELSFAREQRALARDRNAPPPIQRKPVSPQVEQYASMKPIIAPKPPIADPKQLNACNNADMGTIYYELPDWFKKIDNLGYQVSVLQTVYKRRALKAAGAVISTPNKGEKIKLGDIENIKFLVVTSNFKDLEVLHQLIYMGPASKSKLRKNILDFDGFGFNEDSARYKERIDFLNNLGYEVSKRVSFLLGLCTLQTEIPQQDLNELIMYFLMSPCKSKQVVPITQMPANPTRGLPAEKYNIELEVTKSPLRTQSSFIPASISSPTSTIQESNFQASTPVPSRMRQKARKSFGSSLKMSPVKKILLPPAATASINRILNFTQKQAVAGAPKSATSLNPVKALPTYSLPKATVPSGVSLLSNPGNFPKINTSNPSNINTLIKVPAGTTGSLNQSPKVAVLDAAAKRQISGVPHVGSQILQNPVVIPNVSGKIAQPQTSLLAQPKVVTRPQMSPPQEFFVQQQMPDGQQKTFKLIRLPPNHPLTSTVKPANQPAVQQPVIITGAPVRGGLLPPGIIVMKNNPTFQLPTQNVLQTVPLKVNMPVTKPVRNVLAPKTDEFILPDRREPAENDPDVYETLNPVKENPPSDGDLYSSIQEIILSSNFEDITLRNVIDKVQAQYPQHDLNHRHNFMKECVKKIIIGT